MQPWSILECPVMAAFLSTQGTLKLQYEKKLWDELEGSWCVAPGGAEKACPLCIHTF